MLPNGEAADVTAAEGSTAVHERSGADIAHTAEPLAERPSRSGCAGPDLAGRGRRAELHGGGLPCRARQRRYHRVRYGEAEQRRIAVEVARPPERARDGTATWSLVTLRDALRRAEDGLPGISTYTIGRALHAGGYSWQKGRSWCDTGVVARKRKHEGLVTVVDPDAAAKRG